MHIFESHFLCDLPSKNAQFNVSICCIIYTVSLISFSGMVSLRKAYLNGESVFNSWYSIELYIAFEPFMANQANLSCKWMSEFQADTFTASISIATTSLYPHKLNASQLKNLTNHPHSTVLGPDMQFISWKTCRRAKSGRAFYLVSLQQSLLSMLYLWAHFTLQQTGESIWAPL